MPNPTNEKLPVVPMNQFRFEIKGQMTPDGYEEGRDYRCNYCNKSCYYGERLQGHSCEAYKAQLTRQTAMEDTGGTN